MKILNLVLTPIAAIGVAIFAAYLGLESGLGLFADLPDALTSFLTQNGWLQFIAIGVSAVALIVKLRVHQLLKHKREENRV